VFSATAQRGGKITKSHAATPGVLVWQVNTVKMDGSCGAGKPRHVSLTSLTRLNRAALLATQACKGVRVGNAYDVVERDGVYGVEEGQIVFVRGVVAMPCHHIERGASLKGGRYVMQDVVRACVRANAGIHTASLPSG
jgi:hypothetical protein